MAGRRRKLKAAAVSSPDLDRRPQELEALFREKGKVFGVLLFSLATAYLVEPPPLPSVEALHAWLRFTAVFAAVLLFNGVSLAYVLLAFPEVVRTTKRFLLVGGMTFLVLLLARLFAALNASAPGLDLLHFLPVGFAALVFAIVYHRRFAVVSVGYMALGAGVVLHFHGGAPLPAAGGPSLGVVPLLFVHAASSLVAVLAVREIRKRSKLLQVGAVMGAVHGLLIVLFLFVAFAGVPPDPGRMLEPVLRSGLLGFLYGLSLGFLLTGALPFIEHLFEVSTDISLLELTDQNHPVLRRLLLEAPGTYHHSFIVGTLAEAAASEIGANALLSRVGGYYHDIGKLIKPEYFTENESRKGSHHARLSPTMSTLIIVAHIKDGIEIARDYNLPGAIMDFIPQHHGTSVVEYFYHEASRMAGGRSLSRDFFRYHGPRPRTKETAIVSLADSVEAASRSLSDPTPARLKGLVHKIIANKLMDHQLDESTLSFRELSIVENAFIRVLSGIFHGRIAYPETGRN